MYFRIVKGEFLRFFQILIKRELKSDVWSKEVISRTNHSVERMSLNENYYRLGGPEAKTKYSFSKEDYNA